MAHRARILGCLVLLAPALAVGCGPSAQDLHARDQRIATLQGRIDEAGAQRTTHEERLERLSRENESLSRVLLAVAADAERTHTEGETLREELTGARDALGALEADQRSLFSSLERARRALEDVSLREARARMRLETFRSMLEQLREAIAAGLVRVRIAHNRMVVELPEQVLFDSGRAEIKADGRAVLRDVAVVLGSVAERDFQVAGHTDDVPIRTRRYPSNWELSTARALVVTHFLVQEGLPAGRLSAAGFADTEPVAPNTSDEGRARNRRIEIVLLPRFDELPDLSDLDEPAGAS